MKKYKETAIKQEQVIEKLEDLLKETLIQAKKDKQYAREEIAKVLIIEDKIGIRIEVDSSYHPLQYSLPKTSSDI